MEIQVNRRFLIIAAAVVVVIVAVALIWPTDADEKMPENVFTPIAEATGAPGATAQDQTPAGSTPEQATVDFVKAFYTVDYQQKEQWLASLKPLSTADGYVLLETSLAPALWEQFAPAQTVTRADQVQVTDKELLAEGVSKIGGPYQIRRVEVAVAPEALWPTMKTSTFTANALVGQEGGVWKFAMFMNDEQVAQFASK